MTASACRFCGADLEHSFADLGMSPFANANLEPAQLHQMERFYPLHAYVCGRCFLVQVEEFENPSEIFTEYAYLSSYSESWVAHAKRYVEMIVERLRLDRQSQVVEIASNDGYLLQFFVGKGIPALGIEPAANIAAVAQRKEVPTLVKFFGTETAKGLVAEGMRADLIIGNNVLAHVPALNDFVEGLRVLLGPGGVVTMEFPHLLRLIEESQFDTIYHEHFSYFSLLTVNQVFAYHRLAIFDVEELPTHGGSLRIYARHREDDSKPDRPAGDRAAPARGGKGSRRSRDLPFLCPGGERQQARAAALPDRSEGKREIHCGLRRAGQGQHAPELLRRPVRLHRLRRRSQPL